LRRLGCPARWVSAGPDRSTSRFWRHLGARVGQRRRRHPPGGVGCPCRLLDGDVPYDFAPLRRGFSFYGRGGGRCWRPGCPQERENGDNIGQASVRSEGHCHGALVPNRTPVPAIPCAPNAMVQREPVTAARREEISSTRSLPPEVLELSAALRRLIEH
jgi:hypothetical protein